MNERTRNRAARASARFTYANVMSTIACFAALAGGTAYAANTIRGSDIVDNEVSSADVRDDTLGFGGLAHQDLGPNSVRSSEVADFSLGNGDLLGGSVDSRVLGTGSVTGSKVADESLTTNDVQNFSLGNGDLLTGSVESRAVADNSLTGTDINEGSLSGVKDGDSCGPSGAQRFGALCAGSDGVARLWSDAIFFCASRPGGLRLPSTGEAHTLALNHDVPGVAENEQFWTSDIAPPRGGESFEVVAIGDGNGVLVRYSASTLVRTVCVTDPD